MIRPPISVGFPHAAHRGGIGLYEWNPVSQELWWDDVLADIFAAGNRAEPPIQTWRRRVHEEDQAGTLPPSSPFVAAEAVYRLVMDDGSIRHVLSRATYVESASDGTQSKVVGVMLDVTEARESGARFENMLESISDGFMAMDRDFRLTYVNGATEETSGLPRAAMLGRVLWEVFPEALGTKFEVMYRRVLAEQVSQAFEEFYPEPLNVWIEVKAHPSDSGLVVYFRDVTARRAEQEERERLLAAEQSARRQAEAARAEAEAARLAGDLVREQLAHQASHDGLTGLLNRTEFERLVRSQLAADSGAVTALFMDLDRFKLINDSLGHAAGDALLVQVAARLPSLVGPKDIVARLGGDEFVVLLVGQDSAGAEAAAQRLLAAVRLPVIVGGGSVTTTASIGLAAADAQATVQTLLRNADVALYRAKDSGRNRSAWFDLVAHRELLERVALEADLRAVLEAGDLTLDYQPAFDVTTGRLVGVEGLARWRHPERGMVPPDVFIPIAEDTGLIGQLGAQAIRAACSQAAAWSHLPDFVVWVNVSGRQFESPGLAAGILRELAAAGVPADRFGIEVTESVLMDEQAACHELACLARAGVSIAIDDFGTGYSSLARLSRLPISVLKIDRSFVEIVDTTQGRAAIDVVVHLANTLGLATLAEGVETASQLALLRDAGCDFASGYLLGRPAPAADLAVGAGAPAPTAT